MKSRKNYIIISIIVLLLLSSIISFISCTALFPTTDNQFVTEITEAPTGWSAVFANYGTWIWCSFLFMFFMVPAVIVSLIIYFVSKKSMSAKLLEEKKSKGLNPKNKSVAVILSIFFSFWSWLYTYKINLKKFWITFSINLSFWILVIILSITLDSIREIFTNYGTWIWLLWLLYSGAIWLWALLDNSLKSMSFYINYPKSFDVEEDKSDKPITQKVLTDTVDKSIFCMKCGTKLPSHATYCKNCGQKVE
jgi:ribosomal protein L40E